MCVQLQLFNNKGFIKHFMRIVYCLYGRLCPLSETKILNLSCSIILVSLNLHYFYTEYSKLTAEMKTEEETYSTSLQLQETVKTLELKPESKHYSSSYEHKTTEPIFRTQLKPLVIEAGSVAKFSISIDAIPKPSVQWFHNGNPITTSSVYKFVEERDEYSLIITEVKKEYEGEYSCVASNTFGKTTCSTILKVKVGDLSAAEKWVEKMFKIPGEPPRFTTQILPVQCPEGSEAKFQYRVTGTPHPEVQWFKGSFQIKPSPNCCVVTDPDDTGFLIMINAQEKDSGLYTCRAHNCFGEATCSAELIVIRKSFSVSHQQQLIQGQKTYKMSMTEEATESRLYSVSLPEQTRASLQKGDQMIYTIGTEEKKTVASEEVDTLHEVDVSSATIQKEHLTHKAAVLQSYKMQESVAVAPTQPTSTLATPVKQLHVSALTSAVQENVGFTERHVDRIKSPEVADGNLVKEQPSKCMSAITESVTPLMVVRADALLRHEEQIQATPEPQYNISSHQVETTLAMVKEESLVLPDTEAEKSYQVKEGIKILYTAVSTDKTQIMDCHATDLSAIDPAVQSTVRKEDSKPAILSVSETKQVLAKEDKIKMHTPHEETAHLAKDRVLSSALVTEETNQLQADQASLILGLDSAVSVMSKREDEQILHLQTFTDQSILPSEGRISSEKPSPEQVEGRKSPSLMHTVSIGEQATVTCEELTRLSSQEKTVSVFSREEAPAPLRLQTIQQESTLSKEEILLLQKPDEQRADLKQEKSRSHAVITEENRELTADYSKALDISTTGLQPKMKKEPKPQSILQVFTDPIQLPKESPFTTDVKQQRALVLKEDSWNILHTTSVTETLDIKQGHTENLGTVEEYTCDTNVEPSISSESIHVEEKAIATECTVVLDAAEQDFAAQIQEGQSIRQSILKEERHVMTGEISQDITKSETATAKFTHQQVGTMLLSESTESQTLPRELTFVIPTPKKHKLDIKRQLKDLLVSAVALDQPLILADLVEHLEPVEVREVKVQREPRYITFTYLITTAGAPIEITIAFDGEYPQIADIKDELEAAFHSVVFREQELLTSEQPSAVHTDRPQRSQVSMAASKEKLSSTVQTVRLIENVEAFLPLRTQLAALKTETSVSFQSVQEESLKESSMKMMQKTTESKMESQQSGRMERQETSSIRVISQQRAESTMEIKTSECYVPVPVEQSSEDLIDKEKTGMSLQEDIVKDISSVFESSLEDVTIEEHSKLTFSVNIKKITKANWLFNGKPIKSGKEFKCLKDNDTYMLLIDKVIKEKHEGEYTCVAVGEAGTSSTTSRLTVILRGWIMGILFTSPPMTNSYHSFIFLLKSY